MSNPDIGSAAWWLDRATGARTPVQLVVTQPGRDDLVGQAPMSLQQRLVDLPAAAAAATAEDLVAFAGTCWLLVGEPGPDKLGLIRRWIALPFEPAPAFDDVGAPLLTWNGVAWVPSA